MPPRIRHALLTILGPLALCAVHAHADELWPNTQPWRTLRLVTGESFLAEWHGITPQAALVRVSRDHDTALPIAWLDSLANPRRNALVWESSADPTAARSWTSQDSSVLRAGRLIGLPADPFHPSSTPATHQMVFASTADPTSTFTLRQLPEGIWELTPPSAWRITFRQPLRAAPQTPILLAWNQDTWQLTQGTALLARGTKPSCALTQLRLDDHHDHHWTLLTTTESESSPPTSPWHRLEDTLLLDHGERWWGAWAEQPSEPFTLTPRWRIDDTDLPLRWDRIAAWSPRVNPTYAALPPISLPGPIIHLTRPANGGLLGLPEERGILRLIDATPDELRLEHPQLGEFTRPRDGSRWQVWATDSWTWLEPRLRHLGDDLRDDLTPPSPEGTTLQGSWTWPAVPTQVVALSLEVAELEPNGTGTPATQPHRARLDAGELVTRLFVNDIALGDLNRRLHWKPTGDRPTRLWVTIPQAHLRPGQNTWAIRQQPSPAGYDDLLIGRLGLVVGPQIVPASE